MKPPLVFEDVIPRQKSNAANHDQQHNRDIDYRAVRVAGKRWIAVAFCPKNVKPGVAKGGDGMKHRHPDAAPSIVTAEHGKRPQQLNQKRPSQDEACQANDSADLWC